MNVDELEEHLAVFELPEHATIDDLDEQYHHLTSELYKEKANDPEMVRDRQKYLDDTYYVLLQHFISKSCKEGERLRAKDLSFANVEYRRDDPGVTRSWYGLSKQVNTRTRSGGSTSDSDSHMREAEQGTWEDEQEEEDGETKGIERYSPEAIRDGRTIHADFQVNEIQGDIFESPDNSTIVHSVNCQGVWGAGFALELKNRFPAAFSAYANHCRSAKPRRYLAGQCLLIPPQSADYANRAGDQPRHWIACLFTSDGFGTPRHRGSNPGRDDERTILAHTDSALTDLRHELAHYRSADDECKPGDLYSPRINAGRFGIPWEETKCLIETAFSGYGGDWNVMSRSQ